MIRIKRNVLLDLDLVDGLENTESMARAIDANVLEIFILDFDEGLAGDRFPCDETRRSVRGLVYQKVQNGRSKFRVKHRVDVLMKRVAYWPRPRAVIQSAHCGAVHSVRCPTGLA